MKNYLSSILLVICFEGAQAAEVEYQISTVRPAASMVTFAIPYTLGTHEGKVGALQGLVVTDEADKVLRARFQVPIESMTSGNRQRDCHMREALGIDYSHSQFPAEHACSEDNLLPTSGPNSIQYPKISVDFLDMTLPQDPFALGIPQITDVTVKVNVHGVTKSYKCEKVVITKTLNANGAQGFRLLTKLSLSLTDFNVQVKAFKIGFISINVKDLVTVGVNIDLIKR